MSLSLEARFWRLFLKKIFKGQILSLAGSRKRESENARFMGRIPRGVKVERIDLDGTPAAWVCSENADREKVILHLHGGGYVLGSIDAYQMMCSSLAQRTGLKVLLPEYRLAPEHPFPAALEDAQKAYRWLLAEGYQPENIVISGDSAGGGLGVATVLALRSANVPLPATVVCISPWTNLTFTGQSHITRVQAEVLLRTDELREWSIFYTGTQSPSNPLISPVYADFHGFPPMLIQVGSDEILLDDARLLAEKARADGVTVELRVWDGMWHVWHALADLTPESRAAFDEIAQFVQDRFEKPAK
ncbi:MAG: alpha/beta hydrolase [Chloroflexi bacterium HGW-Chloroflexi-6]|nr:MAG: alpha/beta hydrolase [Chloroflexi bacterium HGW-Chloroflexi-6]